MGSYFDMRSFDEDEKSSDVISDPKILVVDDSIMVRNQISKILIDEGYKIIGSAFDGQEAVDQYKKLYPQVDLITLDVSMPKMDGLKALELILKFDKEAKIVMVCALGKEESAKKALHGGACGYIMKPLSKENVIGKISEALRIP